MRAVTAVLIAVAVLAGAGGCRKADAENQTQPTRGRLPAYAQATRKVSGPRETTMETSPPSASGGALRAPANWWFRRGLPGGRWRDGHPVPV